MLARNLANWFPELGRACRAEISVIADYDWKAERGLPFDGPARDEAYRAMLRALVRESVRLRPTYALGGAYREAMFAGFQRHPEGLLVRFTTDAEYRSFPAPKFELPELVRHHALLAEERMLLGEYGLMLDGREWYLNQFGRKAEADSIRALLSALPS